jgi:hypothetical protein
MAIYKPQKNLAGDSAAMGGSLMALDMLVAQMYGVGVIGGMVLAAGATVGGYGPPAPNSGGGEPAGSANCLAGDLITVQLTQVGSTTAGSNLVVVLGYGWCEGGGCSARV